MLQTHDAGCRLLLHFTSIKSHLSGSELLSSCCTPLHHSHPGRHLSTLAACRSRLAGLGSPRESVTICTSCTPQHPFPVLATQPWLTASLCLQALASVQEEVATPATPPAVAPNTPFKSEQPAAREEEPATAQGAAIAVMGVKTGIMNGAAEGLEAAEPEPDSFEAFAKAIQSAATLKATQVSICVAP